jgi:hypothetical protein
MMAVVEEEEKQEDEEDLRNSLDLVLKMSR